VSSDLIERWFDAQFLGRGPPTVTESERGCLERAAKRFLQRIPPLTEVLGQMVTALSPTAAQLWEQLRKLRKLTEILRLLAEDFKTSLLGHYQCLQPWSASS
jgi:hypothetical protein